MEELVFDESGNWIAPEGSPYRSLTAQEVIDAVDMANRVTPRFTGQSTGRGYDESADAPWEAHHPVVRAIWEKLGLKPEGAN